MKTNVKRHGNQKRVFRLSVLVFMGLILCNTVIGQARKIFSHDYLMPEKGKSMLEFYTGVPYVAVGQYYYGFSNRFSIGAFYGHTPINKGFGARIKAIVIQPSSSFRVNAKSTFIYYPHIEFGQGDPWVLAWPVVNAEWKMKNGSRMWMGAGILGISCVDMIFPPKGGKSMLKPDTQKEEKEMSGVFNTFQFGYSKPLSNNLSFIIEVAPVMEGFRLKSKSGFLDVIPAIITTGLSYSF